LTAGQEILYIHWEKGVFMKAVVSKIDLVNTIGKLQSVVASKPTIPILSSVLIEAVDGQVIVSASDLAVSMRCQMSATIVEEGSIALPAKKLFLLIRELTSPQIKISSSAGDIAEITTGTSVFKIHGMSKAEFPTMPDLAGSPSFTLPSSSFKEMLYRTAFSAAREDTRYMLGGVQVTITGQKLSFIGTDGKRLAKTFTSCTADPSVQGQFVVPLKGVEEILKMLDETDAPAELSFTSDKVSLETGSQTLIAQLLSGHFPDVERVIPTDLTERFSIHREELMALLRQVSLFTADNSSSVRFTFETGQLHLSAASADLGEGRVSMPVDYAGPHFEIAFNPYYFLDILRHSKDETILFGFTKPVNPGLITDSTNALFVIMPMRLNESPNVQKPEEATV
jgi:DNA polymerase-3 subunit beta